METERALREAVKYNVIALGPTVIGVTLAAVGLWFGALGPLFETVGDHGLDAIIAGEAGFTVNFALVILGVGVGYVIHRIGRTTLLFKRYSEVLSAEFDGTTARDSD